METGVTEVLGTQMATTASGCALDRIAVIIPVWQPEPCLPSLLRSVREGGIRHLILVDDGSAPRSRTMFAEAAADGVHVCRHGRNLGKGSALKTAFAYVLNALPDVKAVVTADADGQHLPEDILRMAARAAEQPQVATLGVRTFDSSVPKLNRFGNRLMNTLFSCLAGCRVTDTQTGLRNLPAALLPELLGVPGERYEYEMAMLAHLCHTGAGVTELPITTVYLRSNRSSHFRPILDSLRVCAVLLRAVLKARLQPSRGARNVDLQAERLQTA